MKSTFLFPLFFFLCCWVFFFFFYPYHLYFKEQLILFNSNDWIPYLQKPASLSLWIGDFLTQFYLLTGGGASTLTLILFLLWLGVYFAFKKTGIAKNTGMIALLPTAMEAALSCLLEYPLAMVIGATLSIWTFVALTCIRNKTVFRLFGLAGIIFLYVLSGAHFMLFALLIIIYEIQSRKAFLFSSFVLLITLIIPAAAGYLYYFPFSQSYYYPIIDRSLLRRPFLFLLTETAFVLVFIMENIRWRKQVLYITVCLGIPLSVFALSNNKEEYNLGFICEAYFGKWDKVIQLGQNSQYNTYLSTYYINLAYAHKGKLPDELLHHYQPAHLGLFLEVSETTNYIQMMAATDALIECYDMSQAQHAGMLGMLFSPRQQSSRMVRKLAEIAIINGEYSTAQKYLGMLSKTSLHRHWANEQVRLIENEGQMENDTIFYFSGKRAFLSQEDILFSPNDWYNPLTNLLESNPKNKTAVDYLLCYHLLRKDLKRFQSDYDRYYYPVFGSDPPPIYQEALLMNLNENEENYPEQVKQYHIATDILQNGNRFLSLLENAPRTNTELQKQFGTSYWFYHFYAQLKE